VPFDIDVYFGEVDKEIDWRDPEFEDLSLDDDEELVPTPSNIVDMLGFDPRDEDVAKAGDGIMIAWFPPAELADKLAQEGGEEPEELHVTLAYLGKQEAFTDDRVQLLKSTVEDYCTRFAPLQGTLGGNGRFPATPSSDDKDVLIKMVDVAMLEAFREELIEELDDKGIPIIRNHGYTPHMTLAYVDPDYTGECVHPETFNVVVDALTLAVGGERFVYPLNGEEVLKMEPTAAQVHSDKPLTDEEKRKRVKKSDLEEEFNMESESIDLQGEIVFKAADKQQVFGWASVISKNENGVQVPIADTQGDVISADELEKTAYSFVFNCRDAGEMHVRKGVGKLIESVVLTVEKAKAMGIELPGGVEGWWTGWAISDGEVWDKIKKGEYTAFSIHGKGLRSKISK
jgi:2'-5' RNA ligase